MEALFMQAFERRDAAEAQMRRQAASYSHTAARALLAAGHLPPPWLLLHPAAFAALGRRGAGAAEAAELRGGAEEQMQQQVVSYSQSLACALLAAGHFSPAWLLQAPADVATDGNNVNKLLVDLANPKGVDHVHHVLTETNHKVKQKTLEAVGVKPGPLPPSSVEVEHSALNSLLQNDALHSVDAGFDEAPHPATSTLPQKETSHAAETEPLEDPSVVATNPKNDPMATSAENDSNSIDSAENDSLGLPHAMVSLLVEKGTLHSDESNFLEGSNSMASLFLDKEPILTDSLERSHLMVSPLLEKDTLHCVNINHHEGHYFMPSALLDKEIKDAAESESFEGLSFMASPLPENDSLHSNKPNFLEGSDCRSSSPPENDAIETAENVRIEVSQCTTSLQVEKGTLHSTENVYIEVPHDTGSSVASPLLEKGSTWADSLEGSHGMASPPVEKDMLHCAETDFLQGTYCMPSLLLDKEAGHTSETTPLEGPFCLVSSKDPLNTIDHTGKLRKRSSLFDRCDNESSRTPEQQSSRCHVLPIPINESALQPYQLADNTSEAQDVCTWNNIDISARPEAPSAASYTEQKVCFFRNAMELNADSCAIVSDNQNKSPQRSAQPLCSSGSRKKFSSLMSETSDVQGTNSMASLLLEKEPILTNSLGGPHFLASPLLEKATLHCVQTDLDKLMPKYTDDGIGRNDSFVSSESESAQMQSSLAKISLECVMTGTAVEAQMASAAQFTSVESVQRESVFDSIKCQPKQSDHAHAKFSDKDKSEMPSGSSGASSKRAGVHSAESNITTNESLQTVTDRKYNSPKPSCEYSRSSGSGEKFSSLESHFQRTASHMDKLSASEILVNRNLSCQNVEMNEQSDDLYGSSSTMSTSLSSLDNHDDIHDQIKSIGNLSGKALPSLSFLSRLGSCGCISPNIEGSSSASNRTRPLAHEVQAAANYSPERSMSTLSDAIRCSSPILQSSLCSGSSLNTKVTTIPPLQSEMYSPTINARAFQAFCESTKLINLSSSLSAKYNMKPLDAVYQSLPSKFEKLMNRPLACLLDTNMLDPSYGSKKSRVPGKYSLDFDGAFMMSDDLTYGSYSYGVQDDSDIPLNLSVEKYNLEKLSGRIGSSSDYLGSTPEIACFRIDEDRTILGENENQAKLSIPVGRNYSRQRLAAKKPLGYATNINESKGTSSLDLTAGKSYTRKPDQHVHIRVNQDIKNLKENRTSSIRKAGKVTHPLLDSLSKMEMSSSKSERNRSETNIEKGGMPRNIVSNMTSFIPLVKQKQRPLTSCVKRDVRVRALEMAEAAKRREEKKQTEREKRKAAVELERERLKQEKEHRQKQVEQQKKTDADIITRKRQRENHGKRGNERKKNCVEGAPEHQKQLVEKMHSTNAVKDACPNNTDVKDLVENLVRGLKNQLLSDERMESVHRLLASESSSLKGVSADWKSEGSGFQVQESLSDDVDMDYEMSPYEDSDEEDIDILEHKREIRRRRKLIPSWAQPQNLNKILQSNQALDPREVFAHKCSFNLSDAARLGLQMHGPRGVDSPGKIYGEYALALAQCRCPFRSRKNPCAARSLAPEFLENLLACSSDRHRGRLAAGHRYPPHGRARTVRGRSLPIPVGLARHEPQEGSLEVPLNRSSWMATAVGAGQGRRRKEKRVLARGESTAAAKDSAAVLAPRGSGCRAKLMYPRAVYAAAHARIWERPSRPCSCFVLCTSTLPGFQFPG
ncbi:hypothetical protein C2845_PM14G17700 [Panicum miliaceum]|uniref:Inner centromere protein ARK-binding domain-containing protein n=1 Tax=Panicum miliaceum TaxID=4540 RepID=A0A3L6PND3_PANMI|nr:hypothetical protein C2845_PM14G17700 [Panicum miliaceum]